LEKLVINARLSGGISMLNAVKYLLNRRWMLSADGDLGYYLVLNELSYPLEHLIGFLYRVNAGYRET